MLIPARSRYQLINVHYNHPEIWKFSSYAYPSILPCVITHGSAPSRCPSSCGDERHGWSVRFNDRVNRRARYPSTNRRDGGQRGLYYQVRASRYVNREQRKAIFGKIRNRDCSTINSSAIIPACVTTDWPTDKSNLLYNAWWDNRYLVIE